MWNEIQEERRMEVRRKGYEKEMMMERQEQRR